MKSRIVYVNGHYCAEEDAKISIFDRGFLFADAVYEVTCVLDGKLVDFPGHMARLKRSLKELEMDLPLDEPQLLAIHRALVERNSLAEGVIYLQITRGCADRDFIFPPADTKQSVVLFTQNKAIIETGSARKGIAVISMPDIRWGRRDIKTVQLLYSSLAKSQAKAAGADDTWLLQDGYVTEASSANAYIITQNGKIVTRALSQDILHGITRAAVMHFAEENGFSLEERNFSIEEAQQAQEAFITSASGLVTPVVKIDGVTLGAGVPGPMVKKLREIYISTAKERAI